MLSLDSQARKEIDNLKRKSEIATLPSYITQLTSLPGESPQEFAARSRQVQAILSNCTITLDDHVITYTLESHPFGVARHLALHVDRDGARPSKMAVKVLMEEFGFARPLGHCLVYEEAHRNLITVNVIESLQPTDQFWKMIRTQSRAALA